MTKVDSDGDVVVTFGRESFMFAPACCLPVAASSSVDSLSSSTGAASDTSTTSTDSSDSDDYGGESVRAAVVACWWC